jgi:hypothetical protein
MVVVAISAAWWSVPCDLTVNVQVPAGTQSDDLYAVLLMSQPSGPDLVRVEMKVPFEDQQAHDISFRTRLARGTYRLTVGCNNTDRVDERIRVDMGRTHTVALRRHPGNDGRLIRLY